MNKVNNFKLRLFRSEGVYQFKINARFARLGLQGVDNAVANLPEVLKLYLETADQLRHLPTSDPAFEYFFNTASLMRSLCTDIHMFDNSQPEKELCLVFDSHKNFADLVEVCDVYGFGYKYNRRNGSASDREQELVIDLRGKDLDSDDFQEAYEMLCSVDRVLVMEYARCYFE